jgi:acetyltransferase-like isoleucine patch superfamily enzyme
LHRVRKFLIAVLFSKRFSFYTWFLTYCRKLDVGDGTLVALSASLGRTNPRGVHIGRYTRVHLNAVILSRDVFTDEPVDTWVGDRCHIGAGALVYPGVRIGNGVIVAAGAVVTGDVDDGCFVAGNPAQLLETAIKTGKYGVRLETVERRRASLKRVR